MEEGREGLSLQGLAERLEALERENERMRSGNSELRGKVATLEGKATRREERTKWRVTEEPMEEGAARMFSGSEKAVSRKALLGKAGAAAVAAVAAGTLLAPRRAEAADGNFDHVSADSPNGLIAIFGGIDSDSQPALYATNDGSGAAIDGYSQGGTGVLGESLGGGAEGAFGSQLGLGHGVRGVGSGTEYAGVKGTNDTGAGVIGESKNTGHEGVYGKHTGTAGYGVVGDGTGTTGAGVFGRNPSGAGVEPRDSRFGGKFDGSRAQLLLVPKSGTGRPTTGAHTKGEIYLDSAASVFVCTKTGTPCTWRKVTTTSA